MLLRQPQPPLLALHFAHTVEMTTIRGHGATRPREPNAANEHEGSSLPQAKTFIRLALRLSFASSSSAISSAIAAPLTIAASFAYTMSVGTFIAPAAVEKPQSVHAITRSAPTSRT